MGAAVSCSCCFFYCYFYCRFYYSGFFYVFIFVVLILSSTPLIGPTVRLAPPAVPPRAALRARCVLERRELTRTTPSPPGL